MIDTRTEASQQLLKEAGLGKLIAQAGKFAIKKLAPKIVKHAPRFLGKRVGGWLGRAAPSMIGKAVTHGAYGAGIGGGIGALTAKPGERLSGFFGGAAKGGLTGLGTGALTGAATHALAPRIYGQGARMFGAGGKLLGKTGPMSARHAQAVAAAPYTGAVSHARNIGRGISISTPVASAGSTTAGGKLMSMLPFAGTMMMGGGGGGGAPAANVAANAAPAAAPATAPAVMPRLLGPARALGQQFGARRTPFVRYLGQGAWPKAGNWLGDFVKETRIHRALKTAGQLPQFNPVPFSAHTAIADYIKNKKYKPEVNEYTSDDQATINRLLAGISKSRARVVGAARRGRNEPYNLLKGHFQAAGLWS